jgi:hypothetical protein
MNRAAVLISLLFNSLALQVGIVEAAGAIPKPPPYAGYADRSIRDFATPDGHPDLMALPASRYGSPRDLGGIGLNVDRLSGMPVVRPAPMRATTEDPEDAYWDNRISPAVPGVDSRVQVIATYQGELVVGGFFSVAGGVITPGIAAWNGSAWSSLGSGAGEVAPDWSPSGGSVLALTVYDGRLIAAGSFSKIGDIEALGIASWDGTSWTPLGTGPAVGRISALTTYDGKLIAGGSLGIAAWDGSIWAPLGAVSPANTGWVSALTVYGDKLIAGGAFDAIGGMPAKKIASWDGESWSAMGSSLTASTYGGVYALTVYEDRLIAGGDFTAAGPTPVAHLAAWDGTSWSALGSGASWYVFGLTVFGGKLIAGGGEDTSGGHRELRLVSWDGENWTSVISGSRHVNESVYGLGVSGNTLVIGGEFRAIGSVPAASVAAWDGAVWSGFAPGTVGVSDPVLSLAVFNDRLIAGGTFLTAGSGPANLIAAWNGVTWLPLVRVSADRERLFRSIVNARFGDRERPFRPS